MRYTIAINTQNDEGTDYEVSEESKTAVVGAEIDYVETAKAKFVLK